MTDRQLTLGEELRDHAIDVVEDHADVHWKHVALAAVRVLCYRGQDFTTDDVWSYMRDESTPRVWTHEPRAMGAVMRQAGRLGLCETTNRTVRSRRPDCHARPLRIWRVL